jgi:hypothetical protein
VRLCGVLILNTVIYVYIWRLFFLMQMFLVKESIRLCRISAFREILKDMIRIHDIACMVWYISSNILLLLESNFYFTFIRCLLRSIYHGLDHNLFISFLFYDRMLIWLCWVWLPMKSIFQFLERFVYYQHSKIITYIIFSSLWISAYQHNKIITWR